MAGTFITLMRDYGVLSPGKCCLAASLSSLSSCLCYRHGKVFYFQDKTAYSGVLSPGKCCLAASLSSLSSCLCYRHCNFFTSKTKILIGVTKVSCENCSSDIIPGWDSQVGGIIIFLIKNQWDNFAPRTKLILIKASNGEITKKIPGPAQESIQHTC